MRTDFALAGTSGCCASSSVPR